ncbi:MAG: phasin family protein [Parvularculaceae bacterium]
MATKKTTTTRKTATAKAAPKTAAKTETATREAKAKVETILGRIQQNFKEAGAALATSGHIADEKRREVLVTLIENAQANTDATFAALREVLESETLSDSLRIQRDALRDGIERNLAQVRDVAALAAQGGRETVEPVTEFVSSLREKVRARA